MNLAGIIDPHIHTTPDVRERRLDDLEQAELAARVGARAIVFKNHFSPTAARARIAQQVHPGVTIFGGVVLNETMGGLNPAAVRNALNMGGRVVWLPTLQAANHHRMEGKSGGIVLLDENERLLPAVGEIMRHVHDANAVLATGHISKLEITRVAETAAELGLERLVINHPEHAVTNLTIAEQRELRSIHPLYFERCHSQPAGGGHYTNNFEANWAAIDALGIESTVIASDFGQIENDRWDRGMSAYLEFLAARVSSSDLKSITHDHAAFLLGIDR